MLLINFYMKTTFVDEHHSLLFIFVCFLKKKKTQTLPAQPAYHVIRCCRYLLPIRSLQMSGHNLGRAYMMRSSSRFIFTCTPPAVFHANSSVCGVNPVRSLSVRWREPRQLTAAGQSQTLTPRVSRRHGRHRIAEPQLQHDCTV